MTIMQWIPFIRKIQAVVKSVVDVHVCEPEEFIGAVDTKGLLLCNTADPEIQPVIIKRI